jgi:uncharacterized protein DUF5995
MEGEVPRGRTWRGRALLLAAGLTLSAAFTLPPSAGAAVSGAVPNWPTLLPPFPGTPGDPLSVGFDVCPDGANNCPDDVVLEMYERWRPLNAACDHRAVFALTYLRTTEEFVRTIRNNPNFFSDGPWVNHEDAMFGELYFRAFDVRESGGSIPAAWRVAFDAARSPDVTAIGDLLLGMNAHINRDLSYTLAAVGLLKPDSASRKPDHDRVNEFLERVADPLQLELGRRYDPLFNFTDAEPSPFDEEAVLQTVRGFRENAWRNAESLTNASSDAQRDLVKATIESEAETGAHLIQAENTLPGYGPTRDAYCRAALEPSFRVGVADRRARGVLRRQRLAVTVSTDGPARFALSALVPRKRRGRDRAPVSLVRPAVLRVGQAGTFARTLHLTRKGRRLLAHRKRVRLQLQLNAPRGMTATAQAKLKRKRR